MTKSKVSVVIPTAGRHALLERAIRSVLQQTHQDFEIVVVIDGADPDAELVCSEINDSRIQVLILQKSGGSIARNEGVRAASGSYIAFLDDDDEWLERKLEAQLSLLAAQENPLRTLCSCSLFAVTPTATYLWPKHLPEVGEPISEALFLRRGWFSGDGILQTSTLFAHESLFKEFKFDPALKSQQDSDLVLRMSKAGVAVVQSSEPLVRWYTEESRGSVSESAKWRAELQWALDRRHLFTERALSSFILLQVGGRAARAKDLHALVKLPLVATRVGEPSLKVALVFLSFWFLPSSIRKKARAVVAGLRTAA